ncbi:MULTISPECIES: MSHA biogenesis protein MshI [Vibrio]|uniref:MSHA biogenesis protein MshI n=1 Tax=Vibrio kanaloae TaxID=170673 RepID=A0A4U2BF68_9VIBR|nr:MULTISPECIES: MSHA biogenesis protein MshI [Vibrio]MCG9556478.1 MSHA biogenesis protein MshI [Vibrio kanaloae]TKF03483.1 MSHA biogenesis protein MshI [Vibrio kanaloae]TKF34313.1 MSHA biogenesis protein MshI [Vibrio kanaloae]TKF59569.1 MSHA biogenesis protein MshI [Vibrio kanaloae]UIJ40512.1 MSHA biogenesis protein MshI [Vibrio kanaloae]
MNFKAILDKIKPTNNKGSSQVVMLGNDAVYVSVTGQAPQVTSIPLVNGDWESALKESLSSKVFDSNSVQLIVCANYYQTYQIDKPDIPESEWSVALPFLLKDLVSERVTEITASAVALPTSNKLQVYVLPKKLLDKLVKITLSAQVELKGVVPEDEIWGDSAGELSNFLLLQRSANTHFKLGAFVENTVCFQRTIRSVVPPLTGVASSALQLDGLALELQRSIDYLSSQIKGTQLHQLKICCDEEDEAELRDALNNTLSSTVSLLVEEERENSESLLVKLAAEKEAFNVNLYPEHLKPKKEYFTLTNVVASWGLVFVLLLGGYFVMQYKTSNLDKELTVLQHQSKQLNQQVKQLNSKLIQHKPSPDKVAAVARLKRETQAKKEALKAVGQYDQSQQVGYSGVMNALAKLGRDDISLSQIYMTHNTLDLSGFARNAKVVPNWIGQFKSELNLVGRAFEKLKIGRNDQDVVTFELNTRRESK